MELICDADQHWKDHPEDYALTWDEAQQLSRAGRMIHDVLDRHISVDANGQLVHVMSETIREEILDTFHRKRILKKYSVDLMQRVLHGSMKWFSLFVSIESLQQNDAQSDRTIFLLRANENSGLIPPSEYPDFYASKGKLEDDAFLLSARETLHLTSEYRLIRPCELYILEMISSVFQETDQSSDAVSVISCSSFRVIHQGPVTNEFTRLGVKGKTPTRDMITGISTLASGDLTVAFKDETGKSVKLQSSTYRLYDALIAHWTETGSQSNMISYPLSEYMKLCNLSSESTTRRGVKQGLETLYTVSLSFKGKGKYGEENFIDMRICDAKGIVNNNIIFGLSLQCAQLLGRYPVMYLPNLYFTIPVKQFPHAPFFLRRIAEHKRMNMGKTNENIISVETLLAAAPELPRYPISRQTHSILKFMYYFFSMLLTHGTPVQHSSVLGGRFSGDGCMVLQI